MEQLMLRLELFGRVDANACMDTEMDGERKKVRFDYVEKN
jgi:hypothetical protein